MSQSSKNKEPQEEVLRIRLRTDCPCGIKKPYAECCHDYHSGRTSPKTPELLMRSRYAAYFFRLTDYLVGSQHPNTRTPELRKELEQSLPHLMWRSLTIINTSKGAAADKKGKVEFVAQYHQQGQLHEMHEKSRFQRHKGKWKYYDDRG